MLTDTAIRAMPTPATDQLISAGGRDGLYLRLRASGRRTWVIRRRVEGEWRVETIGHWPVITARAARAAASTKDTPLRAITFGEAVKDFTRDVLERKYSESGEAAAYLTRDCAAWSSRRLDRIKRADVVAVVRRKAADKPNAARKLLVIIKQFFRWAAIGEMVAADPTAGVTPSALDIPAYEPRTRVLTVDEIREAWAIPDLPYGRPIRFALLTACRIGEAMAFKPEQLVDGLWTIPTTKNGQAHPLPLAPRAKALAEAGWPKRAYASIHAYLRGLEIAWNLHDLRRTAATRMRDVGVPVDAIEAVLNHTPPRLVRIYQRPDTMPAKRDALLALEKDILAIVEPKEAPAEG